MERSADSKQPGAAASGTAALGQRLADLAAPTPAAAPTASMHEPAPLPLFPKKSNSSSRPSLSGLSAGLSAPTTPSLAFSPSPIVVTCSDSDLSAEECSQLEDFALPSSAKPPADDGHDGIRAQALKTEAAAASRIPPVLCFGDSITKGYHGVWNHPVFGPDNLGDHTKEIKDVRFYPYALRLGARLFADIHDTKIEDVYSGMTDQYAEVCAVTGWKLPELVPRLTRALAGGPWRCVCLQGGNVDIVLHGDKIGRTLRRFQFLLDAADEAKVPVVILGNTDCHTEYHLLVPPDARERRRNRLKMVSEGLKEMAKKQGRVFVDLYNLMPMDEKHKELWDDAIHPSPRGSDFIGDCVFEAIKKAGL